MKQRRLIIPFLLVCFMMLTMPSSYADGPVTVSDTDMRFTIGASTYMVNGVPNAMDAAPLIIDGRTFLPVRYVATPLGASVAWNNIEREVTISLNGVILQLWIDQPHALVDGQSVLIDPDNDQVKPVIIDGRTMLPVRFVSENLNCSVIWDAITRQVKVVHNSDRLIKQGAAVASMVKTNSIPLNWLDTPVGQTNLVLGDESDFPIVQQIGRGYNIFGDYASVESLKQPVLDVEKLTKNGQIQRIRYDDTETEIIDGRTIRDYSEAFKNKSYRGLDFVVFNVANNMRFDTERIASGDYHFLTYSYLIKKHGVYLTAMPDQLKNYLTAQASAAINSPNTPPQTVFNTYGHYVVVDTVSGGRIDYHLSTKREGATSYQKFKTVASKQANQYMGNIFAADFTSIDRDVENEVSFNDSKREGLNCRGGSNPPTLNQLLNDSDALYNWQSNLDKESTLIDFGTNNSQAGLLPIWELCNSQARKNQLKTAFEQLSAEYEAQFPAQTYIRDILFVEDNDAQAALEQCPNGYLLIDKDLNAGAGGKYIYLCYKTTTSQVNVVRNLFLEYTNEFIEPSTKYLNHNGYAANYSQLKNDLNAGVNESSVEHIYLWQTKEDHNNVLPPLKELDVFIGAAEDVPNDWQAVPLQNSQKAFDVNHGTSGSQIYLLFRR